MCMHTHVCMRRQRWMLLSSSSVLHFIKIKGLLLQLSNPATLASQQASGILHPLPQVLVLVYQALYQPNHLPRPLD